MTRRVLQRQILPLDSDVDVLPLYLDPEEANLDEDKYVVGGSRAAKELNNAAIRQKVSTGKAVRPDQLLSRTAVRIPSGEKLSFGTYFNGFPASYWRRWTVVSSVTLSVTVRGSGATVIVNKSMANGRQQKVESAVTDAEGPTTLTFELSLKPFVDGGWYWYDVVAGHGDITVESAEWSAEVPADRAGHGTVDLAITTMNRPDFCAELLGQVAVAEQLLAVLGRVDRVVGLVVIPGEAAVLVDDDGLAPDVGALGVEVLELVDPREGDVLVGIVHHRAALEVVDVLDLGLEVHGAPREAALGVAEVLVDRPV
jgi:galactofuranosylgalactofuranosylrhamnosyl-N-acetylglucosaminyl-diphospho-decaprenol beta-1,5/1,6-galactofuranosyltransferase